MDNQQPRTRFSYFVLLAAIPFGGSFQPSRFNAMLDQATYCIELASKRNVSISDY
jgi:hypothetical protein